MSIGHKNFKIVNTPPVHVMPRHCKTQFHVVYFNLTFLEYIKHVYRLYISNLTYNNTYHFFKGMGKWLFRY